MWSATDQWKLVGESRRSHLRALPARGGSNRTSHAAYYELTYTEQAGDPRADQAWARVLDTTTNSHLQGNSVRSVFTMLRRLLIAPSKRHSRPCSGFTDDDSKNATLINEIKARPVRA